MNEFMAPPVVVEDTPAVHVEVDIPTPDAAPDTTADDMAVEAVALAVVASEAMDASETASDARDRVGDLELVIVAMADQVSELLARQMATIESLDAMAAAFADLDMAEDTPDVVESESEIADAVALAEATDEPVTIETTDMSATRVAPESTPEPEPDAPRQERARRGFHRGRR